MITAQKACDFLSGDKLYQQRARAVLPVLVRQAKATQKIYYGDLAAEVSIPNPRNLNYPLGSIGNALKSLSKKWAIKIPQIQCIVVNKGSELPGEGIGWFIDKKDFKKLTTRQKRERVNHVLSDVFTFNRWDDVLLALGLQPTQNKSIETIIRKSTNYGGGGESDFHRKLKDHIVKNPALVGLNGGHYTSETEYILPSMDTIDILFKSSKKWVGIEVKSEISGVEDVLRGLFQCVKYQALIEAYLSVIDERKDVKVILAIGGNFPTELISTKNLLGIEIIDRIRA